MESPPWRLGSSPARDRTGRSWLERHCCIERDPAQTAVGFVPRLRPNDAAELKRRQFTRPIHQPVRHSRAFRFPPEVILLAVRCGAHPGKLDTH